MLGLLSHEYFHLFNVKNLRPVELGPFDYEKPPTTGSLWIAEGVTSYYSSLLVARAGLRTRDEFLASKGAQIGQLQNAPGRLLQSLEQSSREVWNNSNSGVAPAATTVSYYNKGEILGLLLDARIRHATNGRGSFDDVMRLAYKRYAGAKGYTPDDFRAVAEEIAATDLKEWFGNQCRRPHSFKNTSFEAGSFRLTSPAHSRARSRSVRRATTATSASQMKTRFWPCEIRLWHSSGFATKS
jgi:predicted metalloprotease with PDZ domain